MTDEGRESRTAGVELESQLRRLRGEIALQRGLLLLALLALALGWWFAGRRPAQKLRVDHLVTHRLTVLDPQDRSRIELRADSGAARLSLLGASSGDASLLLSAGSSGSSVRFDDPVEGRTALLRPGLLELRSRTSSILLRDSLDGAKLVLSGPERTVVLPPSAAAPSGGPRR